MMRKPDALTIHAPWDEFAPSSGPIAVGDIHGRLDRLNRLLAALPPDRQLVFLGDYIDRGPDSRGVIERLIRLSQRCACVFLCGNHEDMLLDALSEATYEAEEDWLRNGGGTTLRSYGVSNLRQLADTLPPPHLNFLRDLREHWETKEYVFVHGGIQSDGPEATPREAKLWMRVAPDEPFGYNKTVICGHTPYRSPVVGPDWINIDTGCGKLPTAPLTALLLPERQIVQG